MNTTNGNIPHVCPKCGAQTRHPFRGTIVIHDVYRCAGSAPGARAAMKTEEKENTTDSSAESSASLDEWDVGADGIPVRKGDHVGEEDGELVYLHNDGRKTYFV